MIKTPMLLLVPFIALCLVSCTTFQSGSFENLEAVLQPNEAIRFQNPNGSGLIRFVSADTRYFKFDEGTERTIEMIVRKERFLGELGLYHPGSRWFFEVWKGKRIVAREAEMHFKDLQEAQRFLYQGSAIEKWVYNDEGYVIGYSQSPARNQIGVTLYRYYINGEPALNMPGYDNSKVVLIDVSN